MGAETGCGGAEITRPSASNGGPAVNCNALRTCRRGMVAWSESGIDVSEGGNEGPSASLVCP